jgi:hypothetical protein
LPATNTSGLKSTMRNMMIAIGLRKRPPPPRHDQVQDPNALIDELMAGPIKSRPRITVVGDDAVFGINPAPPRRRA